MKRMKWTIAVTFAIMFAVGVIVNGLCNVIGMEESFFTLGMMVKALSYSLIYLGLIWFHTRRHRLPIALGVLGVCFIILFISFGVNGGIVETYSSWDWNTTVAMVYVIVAFQLAECQCEEFREEAFLESID